MAALQKCLNWLKESATGDWFEKEKVFSTFLKVNYFQIEQSRTTKSISLQGNAKKLPFRATKHYYKMIFNI